MTSDNDNNTENALLVVPLLLRTHLVLISHQQGHFGSSKTYKKLIVLFFWPGIKKMVTNVCKQCPDCQRQRRVTVLDRIPIKHVERPPTAFDVISIDCAGPIDPPSSRGHHFVLVMIDHCTRWPECIPLKSLTAKKHAQH